MKRLAILIALALVLIPATVSAMTWEEFVEEYGAMPPPPPDATNTDVWTNPFNEPMGDYSDGGQSISDMNAEKFLDSIDWSGQQTWLWT